MYIPKLSKFLKFTNFTMRSKIISHFAFLAHFFAIKKRSILVVEGASLVLVYVGIYFLACICSNISSASPWANALIVRAMP